MAITKIATVTVGSGGAASMDFTSIASSFTDLMLHISVRSTFSAVADDIGLKINTASTNGTQRLIQGTGSGTGYGSSSYILNTLEPGSTATASTFGSTHVYIPNYAGSTNKLLATENVSENNGTTAYQRIITGVWAQTAAITGLTIYSLNGGNMAQYSSATLYGITKGSSGGVTVS